MPQHLEIHQSKNRTDSMYLFYMKDCKIHLYE